MRILSKLLTMPFAIFLSANVANAAEVATYRADEAKAAAIQVAIAEAVNMSKANEEAQAKLEEARVEAIQSAVAEAIRLANYCGSARPENCVHPK